ncbi:MAG: hypothetical protein ABIM50_08420 [Novosphingobium sp.]
MAALKDRRAKAEAKVSRASKALESAEKELADVLAAERVVGDITGESVGSKPSDTPVSARDVTITKLLSDNQNEAKSPAELYPLYTAQTLDNINLEAFRTAVWRLLKKTIPGEKKVWVVKSQDGRYWREPVGGGEPEEEEEEEEDTDPFT